MWTVSWRSGELVYVNGRTKSLNVCSRIKVGDSLAVRYRAGHIRLKLICCCGEVQLQVA